MAQGKPKEQTAPAQEAGGIDFGDGPQAEAKPTGELVIFNDQHPLMQPLYRDDVLEIVDRRLAAHGSVLTARDLVVDLGSYFTSNPTLVPYADAPACYNLLLLASAWGCSFGDGGIWPIPESRTLRGQPSEKLLVNRALRQEKCRLKVVLVFKGQKVHVTRRDDGSIDSVQIEDGGDPFAIKKSEATLLGGFGIAEYDDDTYNNRRIIKEFDRDDLERRKQHSAAVQKSQRENKPLPPMWRNDPLQAYERSIRAAMARLVNPIPTNVAGGAMPGDMRLPSSGDPQDEAEGQDEGLETEYEDLGRVTPESVAADLEARSGAPSATTPPGTQPPPAPSQGASAPRPEDFSADIQQVLAAKDANAVRAAFKAFSEAFAALPEAPDALAIVYSDSGRSWAAQANHQGEIQMLGEIKALFWARAAEAGFPQGK